MDFKGPYLQAMAQQAPRLMRELHRTGKLDAYVQDRSLEAHQYLEQALASEPKGPSGLPLDQQAARLAQERVMGQMLEFPVPEKDQTPEPPDDLPTPSSRAKTSSSAMAR